MISSAVPPLRPDSAPDLKVLRIVHRTAGIGTVIIGNDFVFIRQNISSGSVIFPIPAGSRHHQPRLSLSAQFVVQFIARPDLQLSSMYEGLDRLAGSLGKSNVERIWSEDNIGTSRADLCLFADSTQGSFGLRGAIRLFIYCRLWKRTSAVKPSENSALL